MIKDIIKDSLPATTTAVAIYDPAAAVPKQLSGNSGTGTGPALSKTVKTGKMNIKTILIIAGLAVAGFLAWKFLGKKK